MTRPLPTPHPMVPAAREALAAVLAAKPVRGIASDHVLVDRSDLTLVLEWLKQIDRLPRQEG